MDRDWIPSSILKPQEPFLQMSNNRNLYLSWYIIYFQTSNSNSDNPEAMHYCFLPLITLDVFYAHCQVWNKSCICRRVCCMKFTIYFSGGSTGAPLARSLLASHNFLNSMQFFSKIGKIFPTGNPGSALFKFSIKFSPVFLLLFFFMFGSCFRLVCIRYPFLHRRKFNIHKMKLFTFFLWIVVLVLSLLLIHFLENRNFRTDPSKICTWTQFFKVSLLRQLNQGHARSLRSIYSLVRK